MIDKDKLLAPRHDTTHGMPEEDVEIPDVGTVRVRGLTRGEVFLVQKLQGTDAIERRILAIGMVDPQLTESEVRRWQQHSPAGEIEPVVDAIRRLSGLSDNASKESYKRIRDESDDGIRILSSGETEDDRGTVAEGDA